MKSSKQELGLGPIQQCDNITLAVTGKRGNKSTLAHFSHFAIFYGHSTGLNYCFVRFFFLNCIIKLSKLCPAVHRGKREERKTRTTCELKRHIIKL